jgi:hypothetical protein
MIRERGFEVGVFDVTNLVSHSQRNFLTSDPRAVLVVGAAAFDEFCLGKYVFDIALASRADKQGLTGFVALVDDTQEAVRQEDPHG